MLSLLNISNVSLIDELQVEFERGLNLLTGETGSGKSIIVDALGILIGGRFTSDFVKAGATKASVEGLFLLEPVRELIQVLESSGIEMERGELIVRREFSPSGKNKIFVNNRLATQATLKDLRPFLVDIHGQGDQQTLFNTDTHLDLLDSFLGLEELREETALKFARLSEARSLLDQQRQDEAERFQLIDTLTFQIDELEKAGLSLGEEERLLDERRRLNNTEKLSALCSESFAAIYEDETSALARLSLAARRVEELSEYESSFRNYLDGLESARALLDDLALALRDFSNNIEFSPERLQEIELRLSEISRLKRKYGGSVESALEHLARSRQRLANVERSEEREKQLRQELAKACTTYLQSADRLHKERTRSTKKFETAVIRGLAEVAMENTRFQARMESPEESEIKTLTMECDEPDRFTPRGYDRVEFFFSANVGEPVKPLTRVASGGEASRLMLVLKTVANASRFPRTIVFDEIDTGIGGRVSEAVGVKLKRLSDTNQVLCVTHQPQIARFADCHLSIRKEVVSGRTIVHVERLEARERIEELARMLTGSEITESARQHARELLKTG
ncbi:MAG TPA: DNA repair protein RecN [Blastocatellia bacterium]|nr:DNA repair protein RecN [Blastocatellia bacterium]